MLGVAASAVAVAPESDARTHGLAYDEVEVDNDIVVEGFGCTVAAGVTSTHAFESLYEMSHVMVRKIDQHTIRRWRLGWVEGLTILLSSMHRCILTLI